MDTLKAQAPAYTDLSGLAKLKQAAGKNDPAAIRAVAEQFEAMFTRMMLKSMRDAVGKDPMFGSDQEKMYQDMSDNQLSLQLAKGKGLGLADMLVRQLQRMGVKGASHAAGADDDKATTGNGAISNSASPGGHGVHGTNGPLRTGGTLGANGLGSTNGLLGADDLVGDDGLIGTAGLVGAPAGGFNAKAAAAYSLTERATASGATSNTTSSASEAAKSNFIQGLWPQAEQAGLLLGVDPRHLIAQAALETNWGRNIPQDSTGSSSNNLFGMKASADWTGATVSTATQEFLGGAATSSTAQFKAYATPAQSFQDYVALLRNSPRYAAALNTGSNVQAFASGLQRGGYATDPQYANKIAAVANTVAHKVAAASSTVSDLKLSSLVPISASTGAL